MLPQLVATKIDITPPYRISFYDPSSPFTRDDNGTELPMHPFHTLFSLSQGRVEGTFEERSQDDHDSEAGGGIL